MAAVGLMLPPDRESLALLEPLLDLVDYGQVVPETLWGRDGQPNGFWRTLAPLAQALPFVAHGVGLSVCGADVSHWEDWLPRLSRDHGAFRFLWLSDHLGATRLAGQQVGLPVHVDAPPQRLTRRLDVLTALTGGPVAVENSAFYAHPDPMAEPEWLARALDGRHHLLLDLHNLHTNAVNLGFDPLEWLARAPLDRVIELHVSGGAQAPEAWGPFRLDSHDDAVPEAVWALLEWAAPRCPSLRGVTLERLERSFSAEDLPTLAGELQRVRRLTDGCGAPLPEPAVGDLTRARALHAALPEQPPLGEAALLEALVGHGPTPAGLNPQGLSVAARLVVRLRFERLIQGHPQAAADFEADAQGFAGRFKRYHQRVPLSAGTPWEEAALWSAWGG